LKSVILAGGEGTRLRPLTLELPKPVVPVLDRPFLQYQLDLLATAGVRDIVFSVAYQPDRVRRVFGDGSAIGRSIVYAVEDVPLGTGGAVRNAWPHLDDVTVVFNGDVLTDVDLPKVVADHRASGAVATIVLHPVPNPSAYGLVEFDASGRVTRFLEKPKPEEITTDTINAGIYVLDSRALELIPPHVNHSIERGFFPALLQRGDLVRAHVHRGYWIDIGTPEKYLQVHEDLLAGRFPHAIAAAERAPRVFVADGATVADGARLEGPCYVGPGCRIAAGAVVGAGAVLTRDVTLGPGARVEASVLWAGCSLGAESRVRGALLASGVALGAHASVGPGSSLGQEARIPDHSRLGAGA
jgi:mannose-1-phosphate guanylyltransferase